MAIVIETTQINAKFLGGLALNKIMLGVIEIFPNIGGTPPAWDPSDLFAANDDGLYYNFNIMSSLFQDSAGTIPVTAVEQTIAKAQDNSGNGNHASQATAASRFLFTARKNFVASSQWNTLTPAEGVNTHTNSPGPDGTMTAARLKENMANGRHIYSWGSNVDAPRGPQTYSVVVKAEERSCLRLSHSDTGSWASCDFDVINMVVGNTVNCTGAIAPHPLGGGWVICSLTRTRNSVGGGGLSVGLLLDIGVDSYQGVTGYGFNVAWQQSEMGNVRTSYQSVVSPTDYDTVGFPSFARSDGVDDFLTTAPFQNISLEGYTLVLGVIYDSVNTSQFAVNNDGAVRVSQNTRMNGGPNNSIVFNSAGTPFTTSGAGNSVAGEYEVVTVRCSSTLLELSINGNPAGSVAVTGDLQTAVQALVISSNGNRLNGRITGLVIINRYLSNSELIQTQNFIGGLYTP